jgi:hypothetical protein
MWGQPAPAVSSAPASQTDTSQRRPGILGVSHRANPELDSQDLAEASMGRLCKVGERHHGACLGGDRARIGLPPQSLLSQGIRAF